MTLSNHKSSILWKALIKTSLFGINTTAHQVRRLLHVSDVGTSPTRSAGHKIIICGMACVNCGVTVSIFLLCLLAASE
jgi:hypothetical protein